jgi:hypothetical protein
MYRSMSLSYQRQILNACHNNLLISTTNKLCNQFIYNGVIHTPSNFTSSCIYKNVIHPQHSSTSLLLSSSFTSLSNLSSTSFNNYTLSHRKHATRIDNTLHRYYASTSNVRQQQKQKKVSAISLTSKKRKGLKVTMVTAYDYPSAIHVARAGIDIVLVGDSVAMVELGYSTTQPVSMDHMIHHSTAVKRGVEFACSNNNNSSQQKISKYPLLIGDMPFGSYEYTDTDIALRNAYRFVKEGGMDAVKLEVRFFCVNYISFCHITSTDIFSKNTYNYSSLTAKQYQPQYAVI